VTSIPTLLLYSDGREVARTVGALPPAELRAWLTSAFESSVGQGG
jgi:thioredoxin-like negative regulator of GroEL